MWGVHAVADASLPCCRALRSSAALGGSRNLLKKMLYKKKKKFWYDSPTLGSKMIYGPTKLATIKKADQTKTRKEDAIRCKVLNGLIHKAVTEMMSSCEINKEIYDLKLEICKVSLASNFSACRVYWNPASTTENDNYVEGVLQKSAPRIRYLLMSQQILGNVPPVVFVKDKEAAAVKEIEELLAVADFGPQEEEISQNDSSESFSSATQSSDSPIRSNLFGIDHELLNKQIMDYKRLKLSRVTESVPWTQNQEQQLSKIQKKMKMKKKKPKNSPDDDITPQKYLLDRYEADYFDDDTESISDYELEDELQEVDELEADDGKTQSQPTIKLK